MKRLSLFFASWFIPRSASVRDPDIRARYGVLEGWVSIIGNTLLFIVKLYAGIAVHSTALIADAFHTLSDSATSIVVIIGFKLSRKPSDKEHPFGHGRVESVATLIISVLLFVAGLELLKTSILAIMHPSKTWVSMDVILIVAATILVKELMARFSFHIGDHIDSKALKADALHHRSDALSTVLVVVALICSRYGYFMVDGIMGCLVSVAIFISAYMIMKDAINPLLGEPPSQDLIRMIEDRCASKPGVLGVHDIISHTYGQTSVSSLHIEVCHKESALSLHRIAEDIEEEIGKETRGLVVVHIDPVNMDHPDYHHIKGVLEHIVGDHDKADSFHDLRIVGGESDICTAIFDIVTQDDIPESDNQAIIDEIKDAFTAHFPTMKAVIKATPKYSYKP
ncbi:MAG: cation diffusion facilitator family transporter [Proteobacteria bacterium]|nr:cation diffusion facilitator family transporter [Pseudomonadota bacterium]